ncbi:glycosyltransferase family 1 protein [Altericroceibacterium spongiae]|uniref:Glycosyltransferase family 1 protein n=1 Tax=Altericroceibacterium spongiae TaxID=2320269 RepID=A0A420EQL7_9SPHN|nr:glycosyltransferase family 1 protein [Altericroceibacterium spongiae]RKF22961.1 glycosyltransferase family 1 protein [Altericroceibacterium spongiae]
MNTADLRIALFSGNYNYVRDGANQALNRLVEYLLRQEAAVRVYAPKVEHPAFEPAGDLVGLPNIPIPGRSEYRAPLALSPRVRKDLRQFKPNVVHVSSPDMAGHRAVTWARKRKLPVLASVHTRFETYPRYYNMAWLEPVLESMLRRFYQRCSGLVAPSPSMADVLRKQDMNADIGIWSRGVDRDIFNSRRRDLAWRRSIGIADEEVVIGFLGRLVMEKGLDVFADTVRILRERGISHRVLVIGEGPAHEWFESHVSGGIFLGHQQGADLARAVAGMDLLFNPSITETFGNVTLEAMACGVPVVAARATGSDSLVHDNATGRLITPGDTEGFAGAIATYVNDPGLRAVHGAAGETRSLEFSWDRINQTVADTYIRLIGEKAAS